MDQLSRRGLIAILAAVCATRFGLHTSSAVARGLAESRVLIAACSDLKCPDAIGMACLRNLPAAEASRDVLASLIIQHAASQVRDLTSRLMVRQLIRAQIQQDFRTGAVTNVDGWILSLTETRVYALSTLIARESNADVSRGRP